MAKSNQELEQQFIATAREKTGHDLAEWLDIIRQSGETKPNAILNWLKQTHGLNHAQANFLSGIYLNDGQPVYDYAVLREKLFAGKEALRPLLETLEEQVSERIEDAEFIPTKSYFSIEAAKIFACATLMKDIIRVGLDLGETRFDDYTQKAKGLGAMPNLTHMVEIKSTAEVDDRLLSFFEQAYSRVHKK